MLNSLLPDLRLNLISEFQEIHKQFYLGHWRSSQLNGGRFGEVVLRIIQQKDTGSYTPIGQTLPHRETLVNQVRQNTNLPESLRLYITNATCLIMDFRNNRNVAHPGQIDVNQLDASFVINTANWIMGEIVRLEDGSDPVSAQNDINKIIERKIPVIEEIGGNLKVLNPNLNTREKILLCLYQKYPQPLNDVYLIQNIKYNNSSRFKTYLKLLDVKESLVDYSKGVVILTKRGVAWVEKNISFEVSV